VKKSSGLFIALALGAGFLAVLSLALPWFDVVGKARSSVDILGSASTLNVLKGWRKVAVFSGWLLAPILVAAAMLLGAAGRHKFAAGLLIPVGIVVLAAFVIGVSVDAIDIVWGAIFGAVFAALATVFAIMVLVMAKETQPAASVAMTETAL